MSDRTSIGGVIELSTTKKGRKLQENVENFSDGYFDFVTSNYWSESAPEKIEILEDEIPSQLEETALEILDERYEEKERELDERIDELEMNINGMREVGVNDGLSMDESYSLGLSLAEVILNNNIIDGNNFSIMIPSEGYRLGKTNSSPEELLKEATAPAYSVAEDIQEAAVDVVKTELELYNIDVPSEEEIIEYRQSQGSN